MTDLPRLRRILARVLSAEMVERVVGEMEAEDNAVRPPRRRRTIGDVDAARKAAALVPPDELARERARRRR